MKSCRSLTRIPRTAINRIPRSSAIKPLISTRKMSLFPQAFYSPDTSFTPLFRLLDDFDNYSRQGSGDSQHRRGGHIRTFTPKFDVIERDNAYELHGELGGVEKENLHIEFTDPQTITIRGRVEKSYSSGTPPSGFIEEEPKARGAITENDHKAKVEDAPEGDADAGADSSTTKVAKKAPTEKEAQKFKYWVSERSVGEFSRTFPFPHRIDQDAVKANLVNGILSVTVPKAKKQEARRIAIN